MATVVPTVSRSTAAASAVAVGDGGAGAAVVADRAKEEKQAVPAKPVMRCLSTAAASPPRSLRRPSRRVAAEVVARKAGRVIPRPCSGARDRPANRVSHASSASRARVRIATQVPPAAQAAQAAQAARAARAIPAAPASRETAGTETTDRGSLCIRKRRTSLDRLRTSNRRPSRLRAARAGSRTVRMWCGRPRRRRRAVGTTAEKSKY